MVRLRDTSPLASKGEDRVPQRRREILNAALAAFLQFGYTKTSIEDIAKGAGISRPLIYREFKNKEEILAAVFDGLFEGRYERAAEIVASRASKRDKLMQICEVLYLDPWEKLSVTPMAADLYEACTRVDPAGSEKRERQILKYTQLVLGAKDVAEVFMLASGGLSVDVPAHSVLRRRVELLVERFT